MILEKDFEIGNVKYHLLLKTFKDCDWVDTKYLIIISKENEGHHISSWSDQYGFHVWVVGGIETMAVPTMKEMKVLFIKYLTNS